MQAEQIEQFPHQNSSGLGIHLKNHKANFVEQKYRIQF